MNDDIARLEQLIAGIEDNSLPFRLVCDMLAQQAMAAALFRADIIFHNITTVLATEDETRIRTFLADELRKKAHELAMEANARWN